MHLLETYALLSGCLIGQCHIQEEEIDLPSSPYITFHGFNPKGSGRQYKNWQIIIDNLIANPLFQYKIIQVGSTNDQKYQNIDNSYLGKTSYNSLAYLIKHTQLHLGFDSLPIHLASHYDKKIVAIYAHYKNNTCPFFSTRANTILLEPDHTLLKPVFANEDPYDQINTIDHQIIYKAILSLLEIHV